VLAWKWHAQETYAGDQEAIASSYGIEVVHGSAKFVGPNAVQVNDDVYEADHVVIATGSEPVLPLMPGIEFADTSADALRYPELPKSIVIVGGGFIALEFAGIFSAFGVDVTVITRPERILDMLDEEFADAAQKRLAEEGVRFHTGCTVKEIRGAEGALQVEAAHQDGTVASYPCERVLMAVGRRPAIAGLDLAAGGVTVDSDGRVVLDAFLRTTNPTTWCIGDAAGGQMHTPLATSHGATVAESISGTQPVPVDDSLVPFTCFTYPQLASVGLTESSAEAAGHDVVVSRIGSGSTGAGVISAETDGFVKLVASAEDSRILGVQVAGSAASDLIFSAATALRADLRAGELASVIAVHPSFAEAVAWNGQLPTPE
jgi:pyruvate/2-oxoglutarate dehydrogenase complex dihydrolipoamide dehydrogenase (E3) component